MTKTVHLSVVRGHRLEDNDHSQYGIEIIISQKLIVVRF